MNDNETIADIIAVMRDEGHTGESSCLEWVGAKMRNYADRLEAAHKRDTKELRFEIERLKEERNYSGVRERERLRAKGFAIVPKEQLELGNAAKLREALEHLLHGEYRDRCEVTNIAHSALSAPPRKCDVYSADELKVIFKRELVSELPMANEHEKNLVTITAMGVIDTLFAPATEGGNDGNK